MLTFAQSQASKGRLAVKAVELPMHKADPLKLGVRPLDVAEELSALAWARERAKADGVLEPKEDDPIYSRYLMAATLFRACVAGKVDADGALSFPEDDRELVPFFASPQEILSAPQMGRDRLAYLYELHEIWQDEVSPTSLTLKPAEIMDKAREIAGSSTPGPFLGLRPGMRWIFTRSMALMLVDSPNFRLPSGGSTESDAAESRPGGTTT